MSEDDSNHSQPMMEQQEGVDAAVRDHSYLPGTSNPLFPASLVEQRRREEACRRTSAPDSELQELAILELEGVILFPGSTLPLRLRHSPWIDYLRPKINSSRAHPNKQVRIGIVTHVRRVDRRQSSVLNMSFTTGTGRLPQQRLVLLRVDMDEDDEESESEGDDEPSAVYHELMDEGEHHEGFHDDDEQQEAEHDARSETHPEVLAQEIDPEPEEPEELEEGSIDEQHQQQELHERKQDEEEKNDQDDTQQQEHNPRNSASSAQAPLRYDVALVEENLDLIDRSLNDAQEVMDGIHGHQIDHRHLSNISRRLDRAEEGQRPIMDTFDVIINMSRNGARLSDPQFAEQVRVARLHRARVSEQLDRMHSIQFRLRLLNERAGSQTGDPLIGRIGTVATVSYTFDATSDILDVESDLSRNDERGELIVAVLGT